MRVSLVARTVRGCAASALVVLMTMTPSFAHMGGAPSFRPASGFGHFSHFAVRRFDHRFGFRRFDHRFDFDRFGHRRFDRFRFRRFGFRRFNRFGFDAFGNPFLVGGFGGWGGYGGWGGVIPVPVATPEPIMAGGGAPIIINIGDAQSPGEAGAGHATACVTHTLLYDSNGKFVGERQTSQC